MIPIQGNKNPNRVLLTDPVGTEWQSTKNLPLLALQLEPVGNHGNEFAIGGLALGVGDGVAKVSQSLRAQWLQAFSMCHASTSYLLP